MRRRLFQVDHGLGVVDARNQRQLLDDRDQHADRGVQQRRAEPVEAIGNVIDRDRADIDVDTDVPARQRRRPGAAIADIRAQKIADRVVVGVVNAATEGERQILLARPKDQVTGRIDRGAVPLLEIRGLEDHAILIGRACELLNIRADDDPVRNKLPFASGQGQVRVDIQDGCAAFFGSGDARHLARIQIGADDPQTAEIDLNGRKAVGPERGCRGRILRHEIAHCIGIWHRGNARAQADADRIWRQGFGPFDDHFVLARSQRHHIRATAGAVKQVARESPRDHPVITSRTPQFGQLDSGGRQVQRAAQVHDAATAGQRVVAARAVRCADDQVIVAAAANDGIILTARDDQVVTGRPGQVIRAPKAIDHHADAGREAGSDLVGSRICIAQAKGIQHGLVDVEARGAVFGRGLTALHRHTRECQLPAACFGGCDDDPPVNNCCRQPVHRVERIQKILHRFGIERKIHDIGRAVAMRYRQIRHHIGAERLGAHGSALRVQFGVVFAFGRIHPNRKPAPQIHVEDRTGRL